MVCHVGKRVRGFLQIRLESSGNSLLLHWPAIWRWHDDIAIAILIPQEFFHFSCCFFCSACHAVILHRAFSSFWAFRVIAALWAASCCIFLSSFRVSSRCSLKLFSHANGSVLAAGIFYNLRNYSTFPPHLLTWIYETGIIIVNIARKGLTKWNLPI